MLAISTAPAWPYCEANPGATDTTTASLAYKVRVASPFHFDYDTGWIPGLDAQLRAYFYASAGEAEVEAKGEAQGVFEAAAVIPGFEVPVELKFHGIQNESDWFSDGGLRFGVMYRYDISAFGIGHFKKKDFVPNLPNLDITWPCESTVAPFALDESFVTCVIYWGRGEIPCWNPLGIPLPPTCAYGEGWSPQLSWDWCFPDDDASRGGVCTSSGPRGTMMSSDRRFFGEELDYFENSWNMAFADSDSSRTDACFFPHPSTEVCLGANFGVCTDLALQGVSITNTRDSQSVTSDGGSITVRPRVGCEFARATSNDRTFRFTEGPFAYDANIVLDAVGKIEPTVSACFVQALEISFAPGVALLCAPLLNEFVIAGLPFNEMEATFAMEVTEPAVCDIEPSSGKVIGGDNVEVTWLTSWGAPDSCDCKARISYRTRSPAGEPYGPWIVDGDTDNTGSYTLFMPPEPCFFGEVKVLFMDTNGDSLAVGVGGEFTIDVDPPEPVITTPVGGERWCVGEDWTINYSVADLDNCGVDPTVVLELSVEPGDGFPYLITNAAPTAQGQFTWSAPADLPATATAQVRITASDGVHVAVGVSPFFVIVNPAGVQAFADTLLASVVGAVTTFDQVIFNDQDFLGECSPNTDYTVLFEYKSGGETALGEFLDSWNGEPGTVPDVTLQGMGLVPGEPDSFRFHFRVTDAVGVTQGQVDTLVTGLTLTGGKQSRQVDPSSEHRLHIVEDGLVASQWVDATAQPLGDTNEGRGVAWGDYDTDGDSDLFVTYTPWPNRLYRNLGDGSFEDATDSALIEFTMSRGAAWGDYNGDGLLDLFVANSSAVNRLYRNNGDGTFSSVTPGPIGYLGITQSVAWNDYDNDGELDLFVVEAGPKKLFRNDGGTFHEVNGPWSSDTGDGYSASWADYDLDGDADLYYTNSNTANRLLRNDGALGFVDVAAGSPVALPQSASTGVDWGDVDNDGDPDLLVANNGSCYLFQNEGGGGFVDVTAGDLLLPGNYRGLGFADHNLDGDLDLFVVNSGDDRLFENENGSWVDRASGVLSDPGGWGMAWADFDLDGDLDIFKAKDDADRLFRNDIYVPVSWVNFDLQGVQSNSHGVGARLWLYSDTAVQHREVRAGSGLFSNASARVEFGLGGDTFVDSLIVDWPSGTVTVCRLLAAQDVYTIIEGEDCGVAGVDALPAAPIAYRLEQAVPNPFNPVTEIRYELPAPSPVTLQVFDVQGRLIRELVDAPMQPPGRYVVTWDGRSGAGSTLGSGVYFYRLEAGTFEETRRMLLLK